MKLLIDRTDFTEITSEGSLFVDEVFECYTLEDTDRHLETHPEAKVQNLTAIPRGTYKIELRFSPHFNTVTPHVLNVPNYEFVLIHWGNYAKDTDGCVLVGQTKGHDFIGSSRLAFEALSAKIEHAINSGDSVTLEIT